jgi:hypothetical protein
MEYLLYNTETKEVKLPELGRNIHNMVEVALKETSKEKRTAMAHNIIETMILLNPNIKQLDNYKHKLWDQIHIISDFKLDVDSPYPMPSEEQLTSKAEKLNYPTYQIKYRHYGKIAENLISKATTMPEGNEKTVLSEMIANMMKRQYLQWNRDSVTDEVIIKQLKEISNGNIVLNENKKLQFIDFRLKSVTNGNNINAANGEKFKKKKKKKKSGFSQNNNQ